MYESEGGFRLAGVGLEALFEVFREFVSVPIERAERESEVAHTGADNPSGVGRLWFLGSVTVRGWGGGP